MSYTDKYENNLNIISKNVKKYREKAGFTREQLAAKLGIMGIDIHPQGIYDIENNKRTVKDFELLGLITILKINANDLFDDMIDHFKDFVG